MLQQVQGIDKTFLCIQQMDRLWWELYNRECVDGLTDMKSEGADTEKV